MKVQKKIAFAFVRAKLNMLCSISPQKAGEYAFRLFCTPVKTEKRYHPVYEQADPISVEFNGKKIIGSVFNAHQTKKVMILHGFSSNRHKFGHFVAPLLEKNYAVYAFDALAHGQSEGTTVNAVEYSSIIQSVNETYGKMDAYIAHSFGGLAVCLALENLPHTAETRLVLIAPATETTSAIDSALEVIGAGNGKIKKLLQDTILAKSGKPAEWYSIKRSMRNIKATTKWFHDKQDFTTPVSDVLEVKKENFPNIEFSISDGLGHGKIYRDRAVVKEIIDFL